MKTFSLALVACFGLSIGCGPAPAKVTVNITNASNFTLGTTKIGSIEVRSYKVKTLRYKGIDGIQLEPRLLSCADGDISQWRYAKEIVTTTPGTIVKGTSGKVDVFANNEDVIFEVTAQQGTDGAGAIFSVGCGILPGVKSGGSGTMDITL